MVFEHASERVGKHHHSSSEPLTREQNRPWVLCRLHKGRYEPQRHDQISLDCWACGPSRWYAFPFVAPLPIYNKKLICGFSNRPHLACLPPVNLHTLDSHPSIVVNVILCGIGILDRIRHRHCPLFGIETRGGQAGWRLVACSYRTR